MLRKKRNESLTFRVFCVTTLMLLAAGAVTFGIVALATPMTYASVVSDRLVKQSRELADSLDGASLEECGPMLDRFIADTRTNVMIVGPDGGVLDTPSELALRSDSTVTAGDQIVTVTVGTAASQTQEDGPFSASKSFDAAPSDHKSTYSASTDTAVVTTKEGIVSDQQTTVTFRSDELSYSFRFQEIDDPCTLFVTPRTERVNPAVQALGRVVPWLVGAMLLFSLLCSLFYSRSITRPIVRLSGISQHLAGLDFAWKCNETRPDEIGVLGRSLDELSDRLSAALGELQEANAALRRDIDRERELERQRLAFFSAVSHELKTPVTILKGQLSGMLDGVDVYQDRDKYLARSLQVVGRMEGLVQEILTVSRMESGSFTLHPEAVDLGALLSGQTGLYQDLIEQKSLSLRQDLTPGMTVSADPVLLRKAVDNVLSNAVFYAPEGGRVAVSLHREVRGAVVRVENSGSHIPEEALPHVFEAFYRAEGSRNRRTGGSGLGLYLVDMILSRHGAEYYVENTADGVQFTAVFPQAVEIAVP